MRYALTTKQLSTQHTVISTYGDEVWEWICDTYKDSFTIRSVAEKCPYLKHLAARTAHDYVRVILLNVEAEQKSQDDMPFFKLGRQFHWR